MLAEVQEYVKTADAADAEHREARDRVNGMYRRGEITYGERCAQLSPLNTEHRGKRDAAHAKFLAAIRIKAVDGGELAYRQAQWVIEHVLGTRSLAAVQVLEILPATAQELKRLCDTHGWCNEFRMFMEEAGDAGIIPGVKPSAPGAVARRELNRYIEREITAYRPFLDRISQFVDAIVVAEVTASASQITALVNMVNEDLTDMGSATA